MTIEYILRRFLVKIEANWRESRQGLRGRIASLSRTSFTIGFQAEDDKSVLTLSKDGSATLGDDTESTHNIDFEGPEKDILAMLEEGGNLRSIPASIRVMIGGRDFHVDTRPEFDSMAREGAAKRMRDLLR